METNLYCYTRTGRTISEKTMEDGNFAKTKDEKTAPTSVTNIYNQHPAKLTANGHDFIGEHSSPPPEPYEPYRAAPDASLDDKAKKRINPLRIHLGKRPFVDNSPQFHTSSKKRKPYVKKPSEGNTPAVPRVPKLIPKRVDRSKFHHVASQGDHVMENEQDKPVPRLVPKSQLLQFKKGKAEKGPYLKEYAQNLGLQPMVKFKCRKCCSMSFKTLAMLKEHQLVCRAQAKEPALSPEAAPSTEPVTGAPPRVTRKVYLCSACGTYYENWNLFLHMREVHNRHICLFCLGMFSKAEKLATHLTNKHNVKEFNYDSKEEFFNVYNGTLYLMCCVCDEICSEQDDFFNHDCNNVIPRPVPVLVSKNTVKFGSVKQTKSSNEQSTNGLTSIAKESIKPVSDKKEISDVKLETNIESSKEFYETEPTSSDTSVNSENSNKDTSKLNSATELDNSVLKTNLTSVQASDPSLQIDKNSLPNGDESIEHSDDNESPSSDEEPIENEASYTVSETPKCFPPEKEREVGIKLKLSLNNAKSPVIINSTVDPTVGSQNQHKLSSRARKPAKRYEKDKPESTTLPRTPPPPRTPTIKMTICDKADNSFVKTTIYEDNQETTLYSTDHNQDTTVKTLLNNNVESISKTPEPSKPENSIKTTIYDNKIEDDNSLNRVPKLTVRVPKELLDKDSSSDYSSDSDVSDKLTVDENNITIDESNQTAEEPAPQPQPEPEQHEEETKQESSLPQSDKVQTADETVEPIIEPKTEPMEQDITVESTADDPPPPPDELPVVELSLDRPLDKYPLKDLMKVFLSTTVVNCIYCNHARKIAINCSQLALHMVAEHRFKATVDSITAEELLPETIAAKVSARADEVNTIYINLDSYDSEDKCGEVPYDYIFECFQCYFKTPIHKDLYLHNRKMHQKTILLCVMCKSNFYSYSELLCHLCPGTYDSEYDIKFRCCLCNVDNIPSAFRLMVHLRKIHHTCDVCLEFCHNQARLSNHVWKHKLHHLCYRCGIAYRNKPDITNHLFWKHGTQSVQCKKCMQKKWPHVYHFCSPPAIFVCEECNLQFTRAVCLKVHKRFHSEEYPHVCTEEGCTEKFVSKKLLAKHEAEHKTKLLIEELNEEKPPVANEIGADKPKDDIPIIDLVDDNEKCKEAGSSDIKPEAATEPSSKKSKKKRSKDKDALLIDVNLPELNLSESDSSDESDSGAPQPQPKIESTEEKPLEERPEVVETDKAPDVEKLDSADNDTTAPKVEEKVELPPTEEKPNEQKVLEIWDNFKKYQEEVEKPKEEKLKEKTPPLVPIRKHVCESDHDYCLIPTDFNGGDGDKKKSKKSPRKKGYGLSSSSSSSSDSDSSCSCGSNCSCSSSSGSSSSSSSDSDSSDDSMNGNINQKKKLKQQKKRMANRRPSDVDVTGASETPILIPEKVEPPIAETDLETTESETDEEFYDEHPQKLANKLYAEKRNQLMMLASVAPSDGGSVSGEASRPVTPIKAEKPIEEAEIKEKSSSSKKKSKKKKKSKSSRKHGPIKINIPKEVIAKTNIETPPSTLAPNKITISLHSNTIHIPERPSLGPDVSSITSTPVSSSGNKRSSKRRRVPNKFYGYSSDEESPQTAVAVALKPQQPPKLEWRKEDLPTPVTHKAKKEIPSTILPSHRLYNYSESIRLTAPVPDPEPPKMLMNSDIESSDSESSDEGGLEISAGGRGRGGGGVAPQQAPPIPPPSYLNSGTSSLPYAFQRPAARQAREGESVYCYCRCPYDEVSEMIACDADGCPIEWFHFECVGIMVPPKGKWYCPECRQNQSFSGYR